MTEEGLSPRDATIKSIGQITERPLGHRDCPVCGLPPDGVSSAVLPALSIASSP